MLRRDLGAAHRLAHARRVHAADADLVQRERALPGFAWMLDPTPLPIALARELGCSGAPRVEALRYQPGRRAIATLAFPAAVAPIYARTLEAPRADKREPDYAQRGARVWRERGLAFYVFPRDQKLPGLAALVAADAGSAAARSLSLPELRRSALELIRYRPERRAVFRSDGSEGGLALKHFARREYTLARDAAARAHSGDALALALPRACADGERIIAYAWRREAALRDAIAAGSATASDFETLATALGELHAQVSADSAAAAPLAQRLADASATARHFLPRAETRIAALAARVERALTDAATPALIHGDFYDKQILIGGGSAVLLDLDQARVGDPHEDLGCFRAHLTRDAVLGRLATARAADASRSWREACAGRWQERRAAAWESFWLLRLVAYPLRIRHPDWREAALGLLSAAEAAFRN
jgi:hypothetical protein